jgi:hypothetical protein
MGSQRSAKPLLAKRRMVVSAPRVKRSTLIDERQRTDGPRSIAGEVASEICLSTFNEVTTMRDSSVYEIEMVSGAGLSDWFGGVTEQIMTWVTQMQQFFARSRVMR